MDNRPSNERIADIDLDALIATWKNNPRLALFPAEVLSCLHELKQRRSQPSNEIERLQIDVTRALANHAADLTAAPPGAINVAPIASITVKDGDPVGTCIYAPGLPDGEHELFPVPLNPNGELRSFMQSEPPKGAHSTEYQIGDKVNHDGHITEVIGLSVKYMLCGGAVVYGHDLQPAVTKSDLSQPLADQPPGDSQWRTDPVIPPFEWVWVGSTIDSGYSGPFYHEAPKKLSDYSSANCWSIVANPSPPVMKPACEIPRAAADTARLDWLTAQLVDTIYLDDHRIIDVGGHPKRPHDLRFVIDEILGLKSEGAP